MRVVRVVNRTRDAVLAERARVAESFVRRGWGLLGRRNLPSGDGLILTKTNSIHSIGMRFPFDAIYLDDNGSACRLLQSFRPHRLGPLVWGARHVVELPAGTLAMTATCLGDEIYFEPLRH